MNDDITVMERDQTELGLGAPLVTKNTLAQERLRRAQEEALQLREREKQEMREFEEQIDGMLVGMTGRRSDEAREDGWKTSWHRKAFIAIWAALSIFAIVAMALWADDTANYFAPETGGEDR
jgi:hypothetical protein